MRENLLSRVLSIKIICLGFSPSREIGKKDKYTLPRRGKLLWEQRIIEYAELERIHQDHQIQLLALCRTPRESHHVPESSVSCVQNQKCLFCYRVHPTCWYCTHAHTHTPTHAPRGFHPLKTKYESSSYWSIWGSDWCAESFSCSGEAAWKPGILLEISCSALLGWSSGTRELHVFCWQTRTLLLRLNSHGRFLLWNHGYRRDSSHGNLFHLCSQISPLTTSQLGKKKKKINRKMIKNLKSLQMCVIHCGSNNKSPEICGGGKKADTTLGPNRKC